MVQQATVLEGVGTSRLGRLSEHAWKHCVLTATSTLRAQVLDSKHHFPPFPGNKTSLEKWVIPGLVLGKYNTKLELSCCVTHTQNSNDEGTC